MAEPLPAAVTPVPDPQAVLDQCNERVLEREGIPMYLAFEFEDAGPAADEAARAQGALLAPLIEHYRGALAPESADDQETALISVLQVMALTHLDLGGTR